MMVNHARFHSCHHSPACDQANAIAKCYRKPLCIEIQQRRRKQGFAYACTLTLGDSETLPDAEPGAPLLSASRVQVKKTEEGSVRACWGCEGPRPG